MACTSAYSEGRTIPETSSRCIAQGITAAHNFDVVDFPLLQGMGIGKFVTSKNFSVGGCSWNIRLYPDGRTADSKNHVSVYLNPQGGQTGGVRVKFSLSILGKDGHVTKQHSTNHTFDTTIAWGWTEFIDASTLQSLLLRSKDNSFTIRCVLTVIRGPRIENVSAIAVPESSLLHDFAGMLDDMDTADVTFTVGDQVFRAHGCILAARSPVFRAELFGPAMMKEKATRRVEVDDMEPSIFRALLYFIYTDSLPDDCGGDDAGDRKNVAMQHLLVAADRYGLDRLRLLCEVKMSSGIDEETVTTTLALAEQHHCVQLKNACLQFIASKGVFEAVKESNGFYHLAASCPMVVLDILDKLVSLRI